MRRGTEKQECESGLCDLIQVVTFSVRCAKLAVADPEDGQLALGRLAQWMPLNLCAWIGSNLPYINTNLLFFGDDILAATVQRDRVICFTQHIE